MPWSLYDTASLLSDVAPIFDVQVARGNSGDPATGATTIDSNTILGGNLPTGFRHLLVFLSVRGSAAGNDNTQWRFNNDSGSNYTYHWRYANNTGQSVNVSTGTMGFGGYTPGAPFAASTYSAMQWFIPYYNDSARKKVLLSHFTAIDTNTANSLTGEVGGHWNNTNTISRIQFGMNAFTNTFADGSRITLYGLN